jgi:2-keto-4-pentenoate hydratase/2-oxohepta-3-ene-1,7-dioic acid hydratase in catechol pathway
VRLVTYRKSVADAARLGVMSEDYVVDVRLLGLGHGVNFPASMLELIDLGPLALRRLEDVLKEKDKWPIEAAFPISNVKLLAPIPRPRKNIFGIGLNYVEHVEESSRSLDTAKSLPTQPVIFSKPPTSVIGPGDPICHNREITRQLDWEVELAVVIGSTCTKVAEKDALKHVFGYSIMIDVSARDCRREGQWIYSKGQDTFAPFGPCIVTADAVSDPHDLDLWLQVNGVEKQRSNTRHMLFKIPALIADISRGIRLEPGDIIATGTPQGVGAGRDPQEWLWPGDTVEACVEGIGVIRHPVVAG